jgi:hypothetical protein
MCAIYPEGRLLADQRAVAGTGTGTGTAASASGPQGSSSSRACGEVRLCRRLPCLSALQCAQGITGAGAGASERSLRRWRT